MGQGLGERAVSALLKILWIIVGRGPCIFSCHAVRPPGRSGDHGYQYKTNYLSIVQAGIIVGVEATPANRLHEVESTRTMIDRVQRRHDLKPRRLVDDAAYGSAAMLAWMTFSTQSFKNRTLTQLILLSTAALAIACVVFPRI